MSRRDRGGDDGLDRKKADQAKKQEQAEEQEQEQQKAEQEAEHARLQNQVGNEGLNAMFGIPSVKPGQAGIGADTAVREELEQGPEHGGDDDPADEGALTIVELTASWNPGIKRSQDRPAFAEPMPGGEWPEPDEALLAAVRAAPPLTVATPQTPDALLQPTERALGARLAPWTRGIGRWTGPDLVARAWWRLLSPAAPLLQDPWGRAIPTRARIAAIGTWLLVDRAPRADLGTTSFLQFCLDLCGGEPRVRDVWIATQTTEQELPSARNVLATALGPTARGRVRPRPLPERAREHVIRLLAELVELPRASTFLPDLREQAPTEEIDDPLGLDDILAANTSGATAPKDGLYEAAVQGAERLAAHAARLRVQLSGVMAAVSDSCESWSSGAPADDLLDGAKRFDDATQQSLGLLVEVARAAQRRSVGLRGLGNGLRRAAVQIDEATRATLEELADLCGAVIPGAPDQLPAAPAGGDALDEAWEDSNPAKALPFLDDPVARLLTRVGAGEHPAKLQDELLAARDAAANRPALAAALGHLAGAATLWTGRTDLTDRLSRELADYALSRRNGVAYADAVVLGLEADRLTGRDPAERRLEAARKLWWSGMRGGLALVLRWTAPEEDA